MQRRMIAVAAAAGFVVLAGPAAAESAAQAWPTKPVRIVNTFAPGGAADVLARLVADHLSAAFKQQFFVETRAGATGLIGLKTVMATEPDGYNFVLSTQSMLVTIPIMNPAVGYDSLRDLTNVGYIGGSPITFVVGRSSPTKTFADFLAFARKADRPLTFMSAGVGGNGHLMTEFFGERAHVKVEHIPYKGASQGIMDLIGGHIDFGAPTVQSAAGYIRDGTLIPLAMTADRRLPDYPELPTLKELGYPDLVATTWFAISGPAKIPREIAEKVNREINRTMSSPDVREKMLKDGLISESMSIEQFKKFIAFEANRWRPVIERAGLIGTKAE